VNYEQLFRAVFSCFCGQKLNLKKIQCRVRSTKLLDTKVKKILKRFGKYFWGNKKVFLGLAVLVL
jgi:hypothetical protein